MFGAKLGVDDFKRASNAVKGAEGKRRTYQRACPSKDPSAVSPLI
jgi:hypothetical protein